jgi:hypothetical protein
MSLSRPLLTTAALAAAAIAPSAAHAAEGFTAVTVDGRVAHVHSDTRPGLTKPIKITGLASGERVVGLDRTPAGELLALTSAGMIVSLDDATGAATAKFANPVTGPVDPKAALTFAVAPDGASARIITAGRDVVVNLATGATTNRAGLTFAAGDPHAGTAAAPALDYAADGHLVGVAGAQQAFVGQTAPGSATLQTLAAAPFATIEPLRATVASDGSVWAIANLSANPNRPAQSRFVRYDPATGKVTGQNGVFFLRQLAAIADDGPVADDHTAPKATLSGRTLHRHVSRGTAFYTGLNVKVNEGGQTVGSVRLRGKTVGFTIGTLDTAGTLKLQFGSNKRDDAALRRAARAHRKVLVHLTVRDWAGNKRTFDRSLRLAA